jgi:hypothetical protein
MPNIWKPQSIEIYKRWIDAILEEASDDLSKWEEDFLESLQARLDFHKDLTERQAEVLERIYKEKTK